MVDVVVRVTTGGRYPVFYSGRAGKDWLCEREADAFGYTGVQAAQLVADRFNRQYESCGFRFSVVPRNG